MLTFTYEIKNHASSLRSIEIENGQFDYEFEDTYTNIEYTPSEGDLLSALSKIIVSKVLLSNVVISAKDESKIFKNFEIFIQHHHLTDTLLTVHYSELKEYFKDIALIENANRFN